MPNLTITPPHGFDSSDFSTNQRFISLTGTYAAGGVLSYTHTYKDRFNIDRNVTTAPISFTTGPTVWGLDNIPLMPGLNTIRVKREVASPSSIDLQVANITYTTANQLGVLVDPPTGIDKEQYTDKVILKWLGNSKVSYINQTVKFISGGSVTEDGIPTVFGYGTVVSGGVHTPNRLLFGPSQVKSELADRKFYNYKLEPIGAGATTEKWKLPFKATDGSGLGNAVSDISSNAAQVGLSNLPGGSHLQSVTGDVITLSTTVATGSSIYATFYYNELRNDVYTVGIVGGTGVSISSRNGGFRIPHAKFKQTNITNPQWSIDKLWVNGQSDLQASPGSAIDEEVTLTFTSVTSYTVTSTSPANGTTGTGVLGRTFYSPKTGLRLTLAESSLYAIGNTVTFQVTKDAVFAPSATEVVLDIPGVRSQVLSIDGIADGDTALIYTVKSPIFNSIVSKEQILLVEKGAIDIGTLQVTSAEANPQDRTVYKIGVHYEVINSEDVNYPTRLARIVYPVQSDIQPIPLGQDLLVSYQVIQDVAIKGYNVYASVEAAGGTVGYKKLNSSLIQPSDRVREVVTSTDTHQELRNGMRMTTTVERIIRLNEFDYPVSKALLADETALGIRPTADLTTYFVLSAVAATSEPGRRTEVESVYSTELVGKPIEITNQVQEFTPRVFDDIVEDYVTTALDAHPLLDVKPSSVTRDVHIDPVANEIEKAYFTLDFVNKSQSFLTLLAIDDPENTGASASGTTYKNQLQLALGLDTPEATQAVIDSQFDKLASNVSVTRRGAEFARGQVTLSSLTRPTNPLVISPQSVFIASTVSGTQRYNSLVSLRIEPEAFGSYFNGSTRRYEVDVPVIATTAGSAGNLDAGLVVQTTVPNFSVTNETPIVYGSDLESNRSLAERALIALMGVDFGTIGGYVKDVTANAGVLKVTSQGAGDPFMFRDFDETRGINVGGKVDLYIQGTRPLVYQEDFGLGFNRISAESITPASSTQEDPTKPYTFNTVQPLPGPASILSVKKIQNSQSQNFDLEGIIVNGRAITLATGSSINTGLMANLVSATFSVDYYTTGTLSHTFSHHPVTSLVSLTSSVRGSLSTGNYSLITDDDIFGYGSSVQSSPKVVLKPTGTVIFDIQSYTGTFTMNGTVPITLQNYTVDLASLKVAPATGGFFYKVGDDYRIVTTGSTTVKTQIARVIGNNGAAIPDGSNVVVTYNASETITAQYQVDNLIEVIQDGLEKKEYATADVLVKKANEVPIDISAAIILQKGVSQSEVDARIRTALGRHFASLRLGESVFQSDIIRIIDAVSGVYAVEMPLLKLTRADNSYVLGDILTIKEITETSQDYYKAYKLTINNKNPLAHYTKDGGGISNGNQKRAVGLYIASRYYRGIETSDKVQKSPFTSYIGPDQILVSSLTSDLQTKIKAGEVRVLANYFNYDNPASATDTLYDVNVNTFEYPTLSNLLFSYRERN